MPLTRLCAPPDSQLPGSPGLQALVGEQQGERLVSGAEEGRVRA